MGSSSDAVRRPRAVSLIAALVLGALLPGSLPAPAQAVTRSVAVQDNYYEPRTVRIDPGDTVVWTNRGSRQHTVTSDTGKFNSGSLNPGETFSRTFQKEGYYYYHCRFHGGSGKVGQWGVVIVGDPPPPDDDAAGRSTRPRIVVPRDMRSLHRAVAKAKPGTEIVIRPGRYRGGVVVQTPRLTIRGVDRFRTVLHGEGKRANGITVDGVGGVVIKDLTIRNYTSNGIYINNSTNYTVRRADVIKNRAYGVYAYDSYEGVIRDSFGWGSGDSAFYVGQCMGCGALIDNVVASHNFIGYSGTNATGVVVRNSRWWHNGAGIVPNTLPTESLGPNRGTFIYDNVVRRNNNDTVPAGGVSETFNIPFGTGIWLLGVENNVVRRNLVVGHKRYGVLVTQGIDQNSIPMNNTVIANRIGDVGAWAIAYDGSGANNCFSGNRFEEQTGPPEIQTLYACNRRPFAGVPYPPVQADVAAAIAQGYTREQKDQPEPRRPRCQRGRPGCRR